MNKFRILAVGGGTAGHIYPLLNVMEELSKLAKERNISLEIHYVGLRSDLSIPELRDSPFLVARHVISAGKLNRYFTWNQLMQAGRVFQGLAQAENLFHRYKFDLVFSKGGYVSVPIALVAARKRIPIYAHETDLVMGLSNRLVARYAEKVFTSFPCEDAHFSDGGKYESSGQPIRKEFGNSDLLDQDLVINGTPISKARPLLTVIGGSQGSRKVNNFVSEIWAELAEFTQVVHIAGKLEYSEMSRLLKEQKLEQKIILLDYYKDIPKLFAHSTLIVSRSGGTIFEFACLKKASILIPLSSAAQDHQTRNAEIFSKSGAAVMMDENAMTSKELLAEIKDLILDDKKRMKMEEAVERFCQLKAGRTIAEKIYERLMKI